MKRILATTQDSPSDSFRCFGGYGMAHCVTHAGGTWTLQLKHPNTDNWTDLSDVEFDDTDALLFDTPQGATMRFSSGTTGAEIWVSGVEVIE